MKIGRKSIANIDTKSSKYFYNKLFCPEYSRVMSKNSPVWFSPVKHIPPSL
jgi:hypothetical protein